MDTPADIRARTAKPRDQYVPRLCQPPEAMRYFLAKINAATSIDLVWAARHPGSRSQAPHCELHQPLDSDANRIKS
ncbi:uncharacterized protein N7515_003548 [Penicillium bovifimosum]|uniref:Uncharacterized protein n=1 Tax=Penicillium bovifimosum TaxID=126998 RepID=A0A9W9H4W0_9EURO|nr:uncharacterized protein N7515_003548 [Penicillium bovifimosum]KAJ5138700.1 hypothetical protein N7515_003548 [Penicillium bovifimosum]